MDKLGQLLERVGHGLMLLGATAFAAILLIVMLYGEWPQFLEPVQSRFRLLGQILGDGAFIAELAIFLGPGALVWFAGNTIAQRNSN